MEIKQAKLKNSERLFVYLFYAAAFGIPWLRPQWYGILVAALGLAWIATGAPAKLTRIFSEYKLIFLFGGIFILDLVGMLHTANVSYGLSYLETELPLLVFPLIILTADDILTREALKNILIAFVAGVVSLNLASLAFISYDLWDPTRMEANVIIAHNSIVRIHPVFLSVFISFGLLFVVGTYFPLRKMNRNKLGWILFACAVLFLYMIWLNSRIGIAGFLIASVFYASFSLRGKVLFYTYAGIIFVVFILLTVHFSRERFYDAPFEISTVNGDVDPDDYNTRTVYYRSEIYKCSFDIIKGNRMLYGYGTGDFKDALLSCYADNGFQLVHDNKLDAHSEYFAQLHRGGLPALLLFLALLVVPFFYALKYHSPLYASFIIIFAVTALFETTLSSQKSVTFFSMLSPLLMLYSKKQWEAVYKS